MLTYRTYRRVPMHVKHLFFIVLALSTLTSCSSIVPILEEGPSQVPVDYHTVVASSFKRTFSDYNRYSAVEISPPREVRSIIGEALLSCVRFDVEARRRTYAFFIKKTSVVLARYDVQADECDQQNYEPFDLGTAVEPHSGAPAPAEETFASPLDEPLTKGGKKKR